MAYLGESVLTPIDFQFLPKHRLSLTLRGISVDDGSVLGCPQSGIGSKQLDSAWEAFT